MSATATQAILNSPAYVQMPPVELFVEHELRDGKGNVVRKVGPEHLQRIAAKAMQRYQQTGDLSPFGPGHTYDDQYEMGADGQPKLVRKFPETDQPPIWGYWGPNWVVQRRPGDGKYALYATPFVRAQIEYTENGVPKTVAGPEVFREFPRRSPEYYSNLDYIDYVALLRRTPKLDMGLSTYALAEPDKAYYVMGRDGASLLAGVTAGFSSKIRYAMGVDDLMAIPTTGPARYEPDPEPTLPPSNAGAVGPPQSAPPPSSPPAQAQPPSAIPEGPDAEAHRYSAEAYAHHALGMHHTRAKHLMHHLYAMHAPQLGMTGDVHTPHGQPTPAAGTPPTHNAMAIPSGTNAALAPHMQHPGAPVHPSHPAHAAPPLGHLPERHAMTQPVNTPTEPDRYAQMQQTIARLEQEVAREREARLGTEQRAREQYRRGVLEGMRDNEGIRIDVESHLKYSQAMSDQQFTEHVNLFRASADRAPVGGPAIFDPWGKDPAKAGTPERHQAPQSPDRLSEVQKEQWAQDRLDYMRANGIATFDEACERYEKEVNGTGRKAG